MASRRCGRDAASRRGAALCRGELEGRRAAPRAAATTGRRASLVGTAGAGLLLGAPGDASRAAALGDGDRQFFSFFPPLYAPYVGYGSAQTRRASAVPDKVWTFEQELVLGPLSTPLRAVALKMRDGGVLLFNPLPLTAEFARLVDEVGPVRYVVLGSYALEHKAWAKAALRRWPGAELWAPPGLWSYPVDVPQAWVVGREPRELVDGAATPFADEVDHATLTLTGLGVGAVSETVLLHRDSRTLVVTDVLQRIPREPPAVISPARLLDISRYSTRDPLPPDTPANRLTGWAKMCLLVSYFFPEHEELVEGGGGEVVWTEGWQQNWDALCERLLVPPVLRTLLYGRDPGAVRAWAERMTGEGWEYDTLVPAHFGAPVAATPSDVREAFAFALRPDDTAAFPRPDLRGLCGIQGLLQAAPTPPCA